MAMLIILGRWRPSGVFALVCCAIAGASAGGRPWGAQSQSNSQQKNQNEQSGKISGHVFRSDTGAPLNKTSVTLLGAQQTAGFGQVEKTESVRTVQDGSYSFTDIGPGNYTLHFEKTGYVGQFYGQTGPLPVGSSIKVSPMQNLDNLDVHLNPAGVISGTIYDEDNEPLEGIQVSAIQLRYSKGGHQQEAPVTGTRTDDLGDFRLSGLTPGEYYVKTGGLTASSVISVGARGGLNYGSRYYAGAPSIESAQRVQVTSGAEARGIQISLTPEKLYNIAGTILDASESAGQRHYSVVATRDVTTNTAVGLVMVGGTAVGPDNTFTISGIPPGDYVLTARAVDQNAPGVRGNPPPRVDVGYATARVADGDAHVNVQIGRASEVLGRALLENPPGPQITSFRLSLQGRSIGGGRGGPGSQALDANGAFDFNEVPPGLYTFSLTGGQSRAYMKRVICGGRDFTLVAFSLEINQALSDCSITIANDASTVSGQVMDGSKPASGLTVVLIPQNRELRHVPRYTMTATSDFSGQYVIAGVIPGDYYIFAVLPNVEQSYFSLDFPDRNQSSAELVSVKSSESKILNLKPSAPQ
jgi:5-hydroxyisourate hydrolase-like protein (transthyretin family)